MESKEAAKNSPSSENLPGSCSIETCFFDKNVIENSNDLKTHGTSSSSSSSSSSISSDDDVGFVSGEEEFETSSEKPVFADPDDEIVELGGDDCDETFVGCSDFSFPIGNELGEVDDDNAENDNKNRVLEEVEEKVVDGFEGVPVENLRLNLNRSVNAVNGYNIVEDSENVVDLKSGLEGSGEEADIVLKGGKALEDKKIEALNGEVSVSEVVEKCEIEPVSDVIVQPVEESVEDTNEGDSVVEAIHVDLLAHGVAVVGETEENKTVYEKSSPNNESDQVNVETVEESFQNSIVSAESELVESDGVKFTSDGESVVEDIHVNMSTPGVAVVGELGENKTAYGILSPNNESVLVNVEIVEKSVQNSIVPKDSELVESDGLKFTPDVKDIHVNLSAPGVAVVRKEEEADGSERSTFESGLAEITMSDHAEITKGTGSVGQLTADIVQPTNSADGVKLTPEGDFVVENIHVDVSEPGVAVVCKVDETVEADGCARDIHQNDKRPVAEVEAEVTEAKLETCVKEENKETDNANLELEETDDASLSVWNDIIENGVSGKTILHEYPEEKATERKNEIKIVRDQASNIEGSGSDWETDGIIFGSSEAAKQFVEELERGSSAGSHSDAESPRDYAQRIDDENVTDSDEEVDTDDDEGEGKELFDSAALTALLKAATGVRSEGGNIKVTSQDGSRLFSVEHPTGLGSPLQSLPPALRANMFNFLSPSSFAGREEPVSNLSEDERRKLEKLQAIRVKFLRLVQRLGFSTDESVVAQLLYRITLIAGRQTGQLLSLDVAKQTALLLEDDKKEDLDFSLNILVLGKSGVGKSSTINAILGEEKARVDAFQSATPAVNEITGVVNGVKFRVFDTPGLKSSVMEQSFNRSVLSSVKKFMKKSPIDVVLYVDRLDAQTRDLNDLPLLRTITTCLGSSIWKSAIVTLTHAGSATPEGPSGFPISYDGYVTQRSHVLHQSIGQAIGDVRMMNGLMNPVCLVENHLSCRKNREGQTVLANGKSWKPHLLIQCYSMKILSEANSLSKPQDPFDSRRLFGFRSRSPPLPYMVSSMLQSRVHPKLSSEQGGENDDSDIDLADLSDSDKDENEADEYDQLPPFKPLKKSRLAKLSNEQRKQYFEEYDYRVKLLQKKQWRVELKRMKEMKKKGKDAATDYGYVDEDPDAGSAAPSSVPLQDMALPPSFDGDNPTHRYRFLEPTSQFQFLARPVLDTHGWDHDCGYDGVNLEQSLAVASKFPAVISVQVSKDKKEFTINLDSSIAAKHGENGSTMAGFDIQNIGKQLAYIIRGETKFKNFKKNKTAAGISVTFLGENFITGMKFEDQITFGKKYSLVASGGLSRSQQDVAYGANLEMQRREHDYPIGQVQSSFGLSIIRWRGDLALGLNSLAQFSIGRNSKVAVRAGINNKLSGQISVRTSSSDHLSLALTAIIPAAISVCKKLYHGSGEY